MPLLLTFMPNVPQRSCGNGKKGLQTLGNVSAILEREMYMHLDKVFTQL